MYLGSESGVMAYDFYFMRVENDYYYHYTYRDRAEEIIEDGYLRPNFYRDQAGGQGAFAISGSYGQEVTSLQVSGSRKEHMDKIVALKFKTKTEPKYGYPEEVIWDKPVKLIRPEIVSFSEAVADIKTNKKLGEYFKVFYDLKMAVEIKKEYGKPSSSKVAHRYLESAKRDDPKLKNTGHGGLGTWFAGHGGGKPDERATWGDWIAVTPIKHTIKKDDGEYKVYEAGDIVGPCAVSSEAEWASITDGGKNPLKCMPRDKAHDLTKEQRATLARKKRREESKTKDGQKPVITPTFSEEGKKMISKKASRIIQFTTNDHEGLGLRDEFAQYTNSTQLRKLLGEESLQDFEDSVEKSFSSLFLSKSNYSTSDLKPYTISTFEWKKQFGTINTQQKGYNSARPDVWGGPPEIVGFLPKIGGRFVVVMSGNRPYITGTLHVFYCIKYTTLKQVQPALPSRMIEHDHVFYSLFPVEINLSNSKEFNRIYLEWVRGSFY
jgi:hypothetical protein